MSASRSYSFGAFRLDLRRGALLKSGADVKLRPKSFEVLRHLVERNGQLVSKDELLDSVWGRTVVTEGSIAQCLIDVRRAIGDESQKMIRTVPRRGYIFDVPVTVSDAALSEQRAIGSDGVLREPAVAASSGDLPERSADDRSPAPSHAPSRQPSLRQGLLVAALVSLVPVVIWWGLESRGTDAVEPREPDVAQPQARQNSIAVLPFVDMSEAQDQRYLSDGIAEEILNRLTHIDGLRVIARTSSFTFRDQDVDIRDIGAKLDVSHVLEGSVRQSGDRLRITAQLIDASNNLHLWAKTYERARGDLFAVQDEIAASVATALDLALGDQAAAASMPVDAAAHEFFLQGEFFFNRRALGDVARAAKYYEQALTIEPRYTQAWAALAGTYNLLAEAGEVAQPVARARQREAAERALALDPRSAAAHLRVAQLYFETGHLDAACKHIRASAVLDREPATQPDSDCWAHWPFGDAEGEIALGRRRVAEDPLSAVGRFNLALMLIAAGHLDEANAELLKARDLRSGDFPEVDLEMVRILVLQRRYDDALPASLRLPEGEARDHGTALLFDAPGHRADADAALARLVDRRDAEALSNIRLAEVFAFRGLKDRAFSTLERAREAIDPEHESALSQIWWLQQEMSFSPFLVPLHDDPRWEELMAKPAELARATAMQTGERPPVGAGH